MSGPVLLLGILLTSGAAAPEPLADEQLLQRAETEFHAGREAQADLHKARSHFAQAAADYESLRKRGYHNAALFLNQGNANLLAGDLPQAILAYRRGLRLAPGDLPLLTSLATARAEVAYPTSGSFGRPPEVLWPLGLPPLEPGLVWKCVMMSYFACWATIPLLVLVRRKWLLGMAVAYLSLSMFAGVYLFVEVRHSHKEAQHPLVIVARDGVVLRKGNGPNYPPRNPTPLNRGVEAQELFIRGNWLQIRLAGGEVGWVPFADVLVDTDTLF